MHVPLSLPHLVRTAHPPPAGTRRPLAWAAVAITAAMLSGCGGSSGGSGSPPDSIEPRAGERFAVQDTRYINTLIGYGEERPQADYPPYIRSEQAGGDILWGSDLGLPVTLRGVGPAGEDLTLYLFGDTDQLDIAWVRDPRNPGRVVRKLREPYRPEAGRKGTLEGDAIGLSLDADPADGVHLDHVYRNREVGETRPVCTLVDDDGFRAVYLPGIHVDACTQRPIDGVGGSRNTTPTGAWHVGSRLFMLAGYQDPERPHEVTSYLATSDDAGLTWMVLNGGEPFTTPGSAARFIHGFGLEVDASRYQDPQRSGPCLLPLPEQRDTRGILLFGSGFWKGSDVYLAFLSRSDLLAAAQEPARPVHPWYFAGTGFEGPDGTACWSARERDAVPIVTASDPGAYTRFEEACGTRIVAAGIGYTSVVHVDETLTDGSHIDRLVMLLSPAYQGLRPDGSFVDADLGTVLITGDPRRPWIWNLMVDEGTFDGRPPAERRFRPLPVPAAPDRGLLPNEPDCKKSGLVWRTVAGYAPLFIERYTRPSEDGLGVDLYFTVSRWNVPSHPGDPHAGDSLMAYHYVVDVMRTTLRPEP